MSTEQLQDIVQALEAATTHAGVRLVDLCQASPVLLVFLRHAGCAFCRETLSDLSARRHDIEATGVKIVLVHMGDTRGIEAQLHKCSLTDIERIADPGQGLYRALGLKRGRPLQLFGPKVLWRAFGRGVLAKHGIGPQAADSAQMPGLFLLDESGILRRFRHRTAADRPDYLAILKAGAER